MRKHFSLYQAVPQETERKKRKTQETIDKQKFKTSPIPYLLQTPPTPSHSRLIALPLSEILGRTDTKSNPAPSPDST